MLVGQGDADAFSRLYESVAPQVHGRVLRTLGDSHQAEEVTQDVLLEVWRTAGRFDPGRGSALSWLMTIAHHKAVDRVRHAEAGRRRETRHAVLGGRAPYDQTAEEAGLSLDARTVRAAVGGLSPRQRQAIELAYFGGYTYTEVSGLLDVPLGTAKSRIRDGLLLLRDRVSHLSPLEAVRSTKQLALVPAPPRDPGGSGGRPGQTLTITPREGVVT